jgi:hypothetical protein
VVPQQLRNLVNNVRDLSDQMKKNSENPNNGQTPWQRQRKAEAAGDLEKTLPGLVQKSKGIPSSPSLPPSLSFSFSLPSNPPRRPSPQQPRKSQRDVECHQEGPKSCRQRRQAPRRAGHERHVGRYFEGLAEGQKWSKEWKSR